MSVPIVPSLQKQWEEPLCTVVRNNLLQTSTTDAERARPLAVYSGTHLESPRGKINCVTSLSLWRGGG